MGVAADDEPDGDYRNGSCSSVAASPSYDLSLLPACGEKVRMRGGLGRRRKRPPLPRIKSGANPLPVRCATGRGDRTAPLTFP